MIGQEDETAIRGLGSAWDEAWNKHDMNALDLLVTEDVDFIHVGGMAHPAADAGHLPRSSELEHGGRHRP